MPSMGRLGDALGIVGGSAGLFYAIGYLVVAGHHRALGLTVRSADTSLLLSSAWEFLIQGTLFTALSVLEWTARQATAIVVTVAMLAIIAALSRWKPSVSAVVVRRVSARAKRHPMTLAIAAAIALLMIEGYHVVMHLIPAGSVTALLFMPQPMLAPLPDLQPALSRMLEHNYQLVRQAIVGDGVTSDSQALSRLYAVHVFVTAITMTGAICLWFWSAGQRRRTTARVVMSLPLIVASCMCIYTPLYYGVTMKSYRYPQARLTGSWEKEHQLGPEFEKTAERPLFLLQANEAEYVLYDDAFRVLRVVRRELVGTVTVISHNDFLFPRTQ